MSAKRRSFGSDLAKVDAYVNSAHDYAEIPDMSDRDPKEGTFQRSGVPKVGRPPAGDQPKQAISLRLDRDTLERFKSAGPGWQTRMAALLARNDEVLKMISQNIELIDGMESMLTFVRRGELRAVFKPIETTIETVERNIRNVTETTRSLRDQLVVE